MYRVVSCACSMACPRAPGCLAVLILPAKHARAARPNSEGFSCEEKHPGAIAPKAGGRAGYFLPCVD